MSDRECDQCISNKSGHLSLPLLLIVYWKLLQCRDLGIHLIFENSAMMMMIALNEYPHNTLATYIQQLMIPYGTMLDSN